MLTWSKGEEEDGHHQLELLVCKLQLQLGIDPNVTNNTTAPYCEAKHAWYPVMDTRVAIHCQCIACAVT